MSEFDDFGIIIEQFNKKHNEEREDAAKAASKPKGEDILKLNDFINDVLLIKSFNKFNSKYGDSYIVSVKSKKQNKEFKVFSNKRLTNYLNKIDGKLNKNKYIYDIKEDEFEGHKFINFKIC